MLWPFSSPKQFKICTRSDHIHSASSIDDLEILDSILLINLNLLIMLTRTRLLIYNYKPMSLVATYERTSDSILEMGFNKSLFHSTNLHYSTPNDSNKDNNDINDKNREMQDKFMAWYHGRLTFYCLTDNNIILTFQILKKSSQLTTFREYGLPIINLKLLDNEVEQDFEFNMDDDSLVVFEENNSSKILQNGIIANKEIGFIQMIFQSTDNNHNNGNSNYDDTNNDICIKSLEIVLKAVFNFDYDIIDILGFKQFISNETESANRLSNFTENLLILSSHGLQILKLNDFKSKDRKLIKLSNGFKILSCNDNLYVVSYTSPSHLKIHKVSVEYQCISETIELENIQNLNNIIQIKHNLFFISSQKITVFDSVSKKVFHQFETPFTIKLVDKLNDDSLLLVSDQNLLFFYTIFGNLFFSTEYDKDDSTSYPLFQYTGFSFFNNFLVTTTKTGHYQTWNFWKESINTQFNFRTFNSNILYHGNNILSYLPQGESSRNLNNGTVINLPSKTENNNISIIKNNGNLKMMAIYVDNKETLLINNLETNVWYSYSDIKIIDMYWLGNNYLVLDTKLENDTRVLQCVNLPLQISIDKDLSDLVIWDFVIPDDIKIRSVHVNSLSRYKPIKIRSKNTDQLKEGKFYKTAEIILITNKYVSIFDVISAVPPNGINLIKKIFQYKKIDIPKDQLTLTNIDWIMTYKDDLLVYSQYKFFKIGNLEADHWKTIDLFDNVERIVDTYMGSIMFIQSKQFIIMTVDEMMNTQIESVSLKIDEDNYPISVSPRTATINSLHTIFNKDFCKNVVKHKIYLDKLIECKLKNNCSIEQITKELHTSKHYKFALEKILSLSILENKDITKIVELVKHCPPTNYYSLDSDGGHVHQYSDMLEIIGNCLRKIEMKHWNILFKKLNMTPRDLLQYCIDGDEAKMLGVLLLVFLNYNEDELINDLKTANEQSQSNDNSKSSISLPGEVQEDTDAGTSTSDGESGTGSAGTGTLSDDELMLRVLEILVKSATKTTDKVRAQETWDMCFQLIAFLKNLDRQNNSQLVQKALEFI